MFIIISPAKRISTNHLGKVKDYTLPEHLDKSELLISELQKMNIAALQKLMNINLSIAEENMGRIAKWNKNFTIENAIPALLAYTGDVFQGINASDFTHREFQFAQKHLSILSGLHGALRPLDLIMPYRLEIGIKWKTHLFKNLYDFWKNPITDLIYKRINDSGSNVLINLASNEYLKSISIKNLTETKIITPEFKEYKNGTYKFIGVLGKKARGYMVRYIIKNKITKPEQLKLFDVEGYEYNDRLSTGDNWLFTRG